MYAGTKLYHQTDHPTARIILETQEMKPGSRGLAGGGIYFATTPELTGHKAHKKGVILEVTVDLGRIHTLVKRDPTMTLQKLKSMGFDSVCIARAVSSGQEYVVYDPRQVLSIVECRWISGYTEGEVETALRNYEDFHGRPFGSATVEQLQSSCAKIGGWLQAGPHFAESSRLLDSCQAPSHSDSSPATLERNSSGIVLGRPLQAPARSSTLRLRRGDPRAPFSCAAGIKLTFRRPTSSSRPNGKSQGLLGMASTSPRSLSSQATRRTGLA